MLWILGSRHYNGQYEKGYTHFKLCKRLCLSVIKLVAIFKINFKLVLDDRKGCLNIKISANTDRLKKKTSKCQPQNNWKISKKVSTYCTFLVKLLKCFEIPIIRYYRTQNRYPKVRTAFFLQFKQSFQVYFSDYILQATVLRYMVISVLISQSGLVYHKRESACELLSLLSYNTKQHLGLLFCHQLLAFLRGHE